ncbi:MAG: ABC transporter permease, partial [Candidatus Acidiferrales bacterium]
MGTLWQDLKYGARQLARSPGFTAVAILTLALGIGANTAMFGILNTVLLRPLPYEDPERLIRLQRFASFPDIQDCNDQNQTFSALGGFTKAVLDYTGGAEAERFSGTVVTDNLFQLFGARAALGRAFQPGEDKPDGEPRILLGHGFWQTRLGGDAGVVGKTLSFSGKEYVVVGVMPPGFQFPEDDADAWLLLKTELWSSAQHRGVHYLRAFGRLRSGVSLQQAHSDLDVIARRLEKLHPDENTDMRFVPVPLHSFVVRGVRTPLLILLGAVGFVLLIACANVANLLLVRSAARQRELAIRAALGAGRRRIMQQVLTESVLLGLLGGAAGLLVALWLTDLTQTIGPGFIPRVEELQLDTVVLAFTFGVTLLTALLFGGLPAWLAAKSGLQGSLKEGGWSATASTERRRLRSILVVGEVALALILLVGAGLLLRSFDLLRGRDPGFRPEGVLTANLNLPLPEFREIPRRVVFFQQVLENVEALPGVESAALTTELPLTSDYVMHNFIVEGHPPLPVGTEPEGWYRGISPGYFRTLGIPLLRGRNFSIDDRADTLPVVIINDALARLSFSGQDPLGQRLRWARAQNLPAMTIVGVVGDVRSFTLAEGDAPAIYVPYTQERHWWRSSMNVTVRTSVEPLSLVPVLKRAVAGVDSNIPVAKISTLERWVTGSLLGRRYQVLLLGLFALLALALAAVGIFGVLSYAATQRHHEIGIRMALGAQPRDIFRMMLGHGIGLTLLGVALGLAGALALTRVLASLLFEVTPTDPL